MGKGDKKTRKGKIWRGSHGNSRPKGKKDKKKVIVEKDKEQEQEQES